MIFYLYKALFSSSILYLATSTCTTSPAKPSTKKLDIPDIYPALPSNSSKYNISIPKDLELQYVVLGSGFQNYVCTHPPSEPNEPALIDEKTAPMSWVYIGAQAKLLDVSHLTEVPKHLSNDAAHGVKPHADFPLPSLKNYKLLGYHTFVHSTTRPTVISPRFDFSVSLNTTGPESYVIAKRVGFMPSPKKEGNNVAWLELTATQGKLAKKILRTNTRGGLAPKSTCLNQGERIKEAYAAVYWFYN